MQSAPACRARRRCPARSAEFADTARPPDRARRCAGAKQPLEPVILSWGSLLDRIDAKTPGFFALLKYVPHRRIGGLDVSTQTWRIEQRTRISVFFEFV